MGGACHGAPVDVRGNVQTSGLSTIVGHGD